MSAPDYRLFVSPQAQQDIAGILRYTGKTWGRSQLLIYRNKFDEAVNTIGHNPNLGHYGRNRRAMRISEELARRATAIIARSYGESAKVWLFGSRANDAKRGGDVDLFVEASPQDLMAAMRCKADLGDLFDLEVDLIVGDGSKPIHRLAKQTGVRLK